jgi:hypothetical protein
MKGLGGLGRPRFLIGGEGEEEEGEEGEVGEEGLVDSLLLICWWKLQEKAGIFVLRTAAHGIFRAYTAFSPNKN